MDIGQDYVCKGGANCVEDLNTNKGKFQKVSRNSKLYFNNLIKKKKKQFMALSLRALKSWVFHQPQDNWLL